MGCETSRGVFGRTAFHTCQVTGNGNDERPVGMFGLRKATESVGHPTDTRDSLHVHTGTGEKVRED